MSYYLTTSYLYYCLDISVISDELYDEICRYLVDHLDEIDHEHKYLIDKASLKAGTGYAMPFDQFPTRIIGAATHLAHESNQKASGA